MVRINKYLAQCNLGSRRYVEGLISEGLIKVNDKTIDTFAITIDPEKDVVKYKNNIVSPTEEKIYIMLNKPKKYLVTSKDDFDRKTVFQLLPDFKTHLFSIGRLDYMSEGLLLLTNDGDFANNIIHPKYKLPKLYKVTIKGSISNDKVEELKKGVMVGGKKTNPALVYVKKRTPSKTILKITIFEGRKRQIRYMIKTVGSEVLELRRLQIGNLRLAKLALGEWRFLTKIEVRSLENYK